MHWPCWAPSGRCEYVHSANVFSCFRFNRWAKMKCASTKGWQREKRNSVSHQDRCDGILDVAIGGSSQQLPEAALCQLHRALLLLLRRLQRWRRAAGRERCRWESKNQSRENGREEARRMREGGEGGLGGRREVQTATEGRQREAGVWNQLHFLNTKHHLDWRHTKVRWTALKMELEWKMGSTSVNLCVGPHTWSSLPLFSSTMLVMCNLRWFCQLCCYLLTAQQLLNLLGNLPEKFKRGLRSRGSETCV